MGRGRLNFDLLGDTSIPGRLLECCGPLPGVGWGEEREEGRGASEGGGEEGREERRSEGREEGEGRERGGGKKRGEEEREGEGGEGAKTSHASNAITINPVPPGPAEQSKVPWRSPALPRQ